MLIRKNIMCKNIHCFSPIINGYKQNSLWCGFTLLLWCGLLLRLYPSPSIAAFSLPLCKIPSHSYKPNYKNPALRIRLLSQGLPLHVAQTKYAYILHDYTDFVKFNLRNYALNLRTNRPHKSIRWSNLALFCLQQDYLNKLIIILPVSERPQAQISCSI